MNATGTIWKKSSLTDGEYDGVWCGYKIKVCTLSGAEYCIETEQGVRGWVEVLVTVKNGTASFEPKKK